MRLHELLEAAAARCPDAPALIDRDRQVTYAELDELATRCAALFRRCGVHHGERVVIALDNGIEMVAAYFGTLKAGGVVVPLPAGPRSDRLPLVVADCQPAVAVVDGPAAIAFAEGALASVPYVFANADAGRSGRAAALVPALTADRDFVAAPGLDDALAAIVYTSGSTGQPRGVMLSHRNFVANARSIIAYLHLTGRDRVLCVLPFYYVYGLSLLHTHIAVGGALVIENRAAFPNVVLASMAEHRATGFAGVPSTFALMLHRSQLDSTSLPDLRYVTQAGGAMSVARIDEWRARGPKADFFVMYGATEAAARLTYLPPADWPRKRGSVGRAIPGVELRIVTADGRPAATGEPGEVVAHGDNIALGYWHRPEETAERFSAQGYRTGDIGYLDAEGFLYLVGRLHDMIKVGANRVGAREIEEVFETHAAVAEAVVIAAPHDLLGEVPVAAVTLTSSLDDAENALRAFCAAQLAAFKVPVRVVVLPEMPRLPTGKTDRRAVRERLVADPSSVA